MIEDALWEQLEWQDSPGGLPRFKRISEAIIRRIRSGQVVPGQRLPSSRRLAQLLGTHRNTILAAYDELDAQGYLSTQSGRGTFVSKELQLDENVSPKRFDNQREVKLRLAPSPRVYQAPDLSDALPLLGGLPDLRLIPTDLLARAYRTALKSNRGSSLDYQSPFGNERFIAALSQYLTENRGVAIGEGEVLVTRGSQQALYLAARALYRPGSVFAVEKAGYPPAWEGFKLAGCTIEPVSIDAEGLLVTQLAELCKKRDVAAVYLTPHHQYPTTATLSASRRMELMALAKRRRFVIIEDDYDHEFHFDAQPVLPLKAADDAGVVLHIGTLSKVFAPGLRLGYAIGQRSLIELMVNNRLYVDRQGDHTLELALGHLIEDGELKAHVRRMHRSYRVRRECLFDGLERYLGDELELSRPAGGLAVWGHLRAKVSASAWANAAREEGVVIQPARLFYMDRRERPQVRLGYARLSEAEIYEAVRRLRRALNKLTSKK